MSSTDKRKSSLVDNLRHSGILGFHMQKIKNAIFELFKFPVPFNQVYPRYWFLVLLLLVAVDLGSKKLITDHMNFFLSQHQIQDLQLNPTHGSLYDGRDQLDILGENGSLIKLRLVFNDQFVFGLGPSAPRLGFFLTLFAIIFLFFYRWHNYNLGHPLAWLLVFSGAAGNLIDKMFIKSLITREWVFTIFPRKGYVSGVVDFVECIWFGWDRAAELPLLGFLSWHSWPSFNFADSLIVVGITIMVFTMNFKEETGKS